MINSPGVLASSCTEAFAIETEGCSESEGGDEAWNVLKLTFPSVLGGEVQNEPFWNSVSKSRGSGCTDALQGRCQARWCWSRTQSCNQGWTVQGLEQPQLSGKAAKSLFSSLCFMA